MGNNSLVGKDRLEAANKMYFVCSGNIIRSSFAHLYAHFLEIDHVDSFGTRYHNDVIHPRSAQKLLELGVDQAVIDSFCPKHIDNVNLNSAGDIYFVMTSQHRQDLLGHGISLDSIFFLTELLGYQSDIADPYFEGNYEEAYSIIKKAIDQISKLIQ